MVNGDARNMFKHQNDRAIDMVLDNLEEVVERIVDSKIQHISEGFPSLTEMVQFLIESEYLGQKDYNTIFDKVSKRKMSYEENISKE